MLLRTLRLGVYCVGVTCLAGAVFAFASAKAKRIQNEAAPHLSTAVLRTGTAWAKSEAGSAAVDGVNEVAGRIVSTVMGAREVSQPSVGPAALLKGFDPLKHELVGGKLVSKLSDGRVAELSLEPGLQRHVQGLLERYQVPYGALAAMDPNTGRILAYVNHSSAEPGARDLLRDSTPPAASVFKLVTTAALLDHGVDPKVRVCYGGGASSIESRDLEDNPGRDRNCASLTNALGRSVNTVFAKLADRRLNQTSLRRYAEAFGFGHALPFDVKMQSGRAEVPSGRLEFARTAAGFWHMHMSPLHAVLVSATVANSGVMPRASMIRRVTEPSGEVVYSHRPSPFRSVIPASTARVLGRMMEGTVTKGTARRAFFDERGNAFLPGIRVAGKTGSLSTDRPYRAYSWWVGFAPADKPEIAVAALVVNSPKWRIKGSYLAREALRNYLVTRVRKQRSRAEVDKSGS